MFGVSQLMNFISKIDINQRTSELIMINLIYKAKISLPFTLSNTLHFGQFSFLFW